MKNFIIIILPTLLLWSCQSNNGTKEVLSAVEFQSAIDKNQGALILDVRTPGEFENGHISNALNVDWNSDSFDAEVAKLDKEKPIYVYCLSGNRSSSAAHKLRNDGFKQVFELDGGMMSWRSQNLSETTNETHENKGITFEEFKQQLETDKTVIVDFNADWCKPCQLLKPILEEISKEKAEKVVIISINADNNPELCKAMNVEALPFIQIYKKEQVIWSHEGFVDKTTLLKELQ